MNNFEILLKVMKAKKPKSKTKMDKSGLHIETVEIHDKKRGNYIAKRWKKTDDIPIRGLENGKTKTGTKKLDGKSTGKKGLPNDNKPTIRDGLRVSVGNGESGKTGNESGKHEEHGGLPEQRSRKLKIKIKKPTVEQPVRDANNIYDGEIPQLSPDTMLAENELKRNNPTPENLLINNPSLLELKSSLEKNGYKCDVSTKIPRFVYKKPDGMTDSDWEDFEKQKRPFLDIVHNKTQYLAVTTNKKGKDVVQILKVGVPRSNLGVFQYKLSYVSKAVLTVPELFKKIYGHSPVIDGAVLEAKEKVSQHISEKTNNEVKSKANAILGRAIKDLSTEDYQVLKKYDDNGEQIPKEAIKKAWQILTPYFQPNSKILDPSAGIGTWAEGKSKEFNFTLCDTDGTKGEIAKILYPNTNVKTQHFEEMFMNRLGKPEKDYKGEKFDGVVGNPPSGKIEGKYKGIEGKGYTRYEDYFLSRSLDTIKEGGVVGMFVPSSFLSKGGVSDRSKQKVLDKCELLDAYRFPENTFPNEKFSLDFVLLRKNTTDTKDNSLAYGDKFFKANKDKVFGKSVQMTNSKQKVKDAVVGDLQSFLSYTPKEGVFKSVAMSEEHKRKIAEAMEGNKNALGHHGNGRDAHEEVKTGRKKKVKIKEEVFRVAGETRTGEDFDKEYQSHIHPTDLKNHQHMNHLGQYDMTKVNYEKDHTFFHKGQYYPKYLYLSGNLTDKLIDLAEYDKDELIKKHGQEAYEHQLKSLKSLLPKEIKLKEISFNPLEPFAENHMIGEGNAWYIKSLQEKDALGVIGDKLSTGFIRGTQVTSSKESEVNLFDTDILGSLVLAKNENKDTEGRRGRKSNNNNFTTTNENDYSLYYLGESYDSNGEIRQKLYPLLGKTFNGVQPLIPDRAVGLQIMKDMYEKGTIPYPADILAGRKNGESMEKFKNRLEKEYPGNFTIPVSDKSSEVQAELKKFQGDLSKFAIQRHNEIIEERMGDTEEESSYHKKSLKEAFYHYLDNLSESAVLNLGCPKAEVRGYLNGDDISSKDMTNEEKMRISQVRKETAERLFNSFIEELPPDIKENIQKEYNHIFNSYVPVDGKNVPITVNGLAKKFRGNNLIVKEKQIQNSARHLAMGTGVDVAEVGVGKTMIGILSTVANMQSGGCNRPLIVVPANLLGKWENEISQIFPTIKINKLGTDQINEFIKNNKTGVPYEPEDGTITLMTSSVFEGKFRFSKDVQNDLTKELGDVFNDPDEKKDEKKPDSIESKICLFDKAGFDSITVDEAHKMNKILFNTDNEKKRWGRNEYPEISSGEGSKVGRKLLLASRYIAKNNNNKNVLLLTATPTTNNPLEVYSLLSVVKKEQLERMGIRSSKDFLNTFAKTSVEYVPVAGEVGVKPKTVLRGYKNAKAFKNLVQGFMLHTTGEEAGVERPASYKEAVLVPETPKQKEQREQMQKIYSLSAEQGRGEYALMSIMGQRMNNMSPHLIGKDTALAETWNALRESTGGSGASLPDTINIPEYIDNGLVEKAKKENFNSMNESQKKSFMDKHNITDHKDFSNSVKHNILSGEHYLASVISRESNKTRLALDTIGEVYNQHKSIKDTPMSGQILFVPQGLRIPGHEKMGTLDCYRKYISERHGIPLESIGVMDASPDMKKAKKDANGEDVTKWDEMVKNFNNPNHPLKIIIGSDVINEGVDLNGCTIAAHNLAPDWNPTTAVQKEGRSRRQGNRFNVTQFYNYCVENSVDSVLLQKNGEKTDRINAMFSKGDDANNFIDTSDINPDELKFDIMRDPQKRAKLESEAEARADKFNLGAVGAKAEKINSLMNDIAITHKGVQNSYNSLEKAQLNPKGLSPEQFAKSIEIENKKVHKAEKAYGDQLARIQKYNPSYKESENDWNFSDGFEGKTDAIKELSGLYNSAKKEYFETERSLSDKQSKSFEEKYKKYSELEKQRKIADQSESWENDDHYSKIVKDNASKILGIAFKGGHKHERLSDGTWKSSILNLLGYLPTINCYKTAILNFVEYRRSLPKEIRIGKSISLVEYIFKAKKGEKLDKSKLVLVRKIVHKPNKKPFPQSFWVSPDKVDKYLKEGYHIAENKHNLDSAKHPQQVEAKPDTKKVKKKKEKEIKEAIQPLNTTENESDDDEDIFKNVEMDDSLNGEIEKLNEIISKNPKKKSEKLKTKFPSKDIYVLDSPYVTPEEYAKGLDETTIKHPHLRITKNEYQNIYLHPDMKVRIDWFLRFAERHSLEYDIELNHHGQNIIRYKPRDLDGTPKFNGLFKKAVRDRLERHVDEDGFDNVYNKLLNSLHNMGKDPEKFRLKINEMKTPPEVLHKFITGVTQNAARNFKKEKAMENSVIAKDKDGKQIFNEFGIPERHHFGNMSEIEENRTQLKHGVYSPSAEDVVMGMEDEVVLWEKAMELHKQEVKEQDSGYQIGRNFIESKRGKSPTTERDLAIWELMNEQKRGIGNHMKGKVNYKEIIQELSKRGHGMVNINALKNTIRSISNHVIGFKKNKPVEQASVEISDLETPIGFNENNILLESPIKIVIRPDGMPEAKLSDNYPDTAIKPEVISYFNKMSPFNKHAKAKLNKVNTDMESMDNPNDLTHFKGRGNIPFIVEDAQRDNKGGKAKNSYKIYAFYKRIQDNFGSDKQIVVYLKKVKMDNRDLEGKKVKQPPKPKGRKKKNEVIETPLKNEPIPEIQKPTRTRIKREEKVDEPVKTTRIKRNNGRGVKAPVW